MSDFSRLCCMARRHYVVDDFAAKIFEITRSDIFEASEVTDKELHLAEAFALLWQDWFTGDVDGLWTDPCLLGAIYSCMLLELLALARVRLIKKRPDVFVKVINRELTDSYLDKTIFLEFLFNDDHRVPEATVNHRISKAVEWKFISRKNCATHTLGNLKKKKVLKQCTECCGLRRLYQTVNLEPHGKLEREIRMIALKGKTPDCYMRILLTFAVIADDYASPRNKILKRYFTKNEYAAAIAKIVKITNAWTPLGLQSFL